MNRSCVFDCFLKLFLFEMCVLLSNNSRSQSTTFTYSDAESEAVDEFSKKLSCFFMGFKYFFEYCDIIVSMSCYSSCRYIIVLFLIFIIILFKSWNLYCLLFNKIYLILFFILYVNS